MIGDESTAALVQSALDRVVAAKTAVQAVLLGADDIPAMTELDDAKRLLLRARTRAADATAPDLVTGEQARDVPNGSLLIQCTTAGEPYVECSPFRMSGSARWAMVSAESTQSFRVLYRLSAPAPKVGDIVTTEAQLRALQVGAVVRAVGGMRVSYERLHNHQWHAAGDTSPKSPDVVLRCGGVRVLDLADPADGTAS